jgi:hypothetical protein
LILAKEFSNLYSTLEQQKLEIAETRKTQKLTKSEEQMFEVVKVTIQSAQVKIQKEVTDVEKLVKNKD